MEHNWDDLRVFLAVARDETLSAAGKRLKSPATVGRRISRMEERYGTPLFAKSPSGYALTDAGSRLIPHAEKMEQVISGLDEDLGQATGSHQRSNSHWRTRWMCDFILPQVCARIADQNPDLDIQIVALPRVVNLSKREADMAIAVSPPTSGRLSVQKLCDYHLPCGLSAIFGYKWRDHVRPRFMVSHCRLYQ